MDMIIAQVFPDTVEEFMEQNKMVDEDHVYSNGVEYVPIFRMMQWFEHRPERKKGKWKNHIEDGYIECPFCGAATNCDGDIEELHFCFSCGARLEE